MANKLNVDEVSLLEEIGAAFDADNQVAMKAAMFSQPDGEMQRQGDAVWRDVPMISTTTQGLDISSAFGSVTELQVPSVLNTIENVPWQLNAQELRNPRYRERKAKSGAQALSAAVNRSIANKVAIEGSLTVAQSSALTGYDDVSLCDALMLENDVLGTEKTMVLNPRDYNRMGGNLASRTLMSRSETALSSTAVGPIANFDTFTTSFGPTLTAAAGGATTVTGAQRYVPEATSTAATGEVQKVDNRSMPLTVSNTTGVKAGDKFTIAGINALSHVNKQDTGQLKTFTVKSITSGTVMEISPPLIVGDGTSDAEDDYANVTAATAGGEALTWLNTTTAQTNVFFMNDSIEIFGGHLVFDDGDNMAVERLMTDSGIEIIFGRQSFLGTGITDYRLTIFFGTTNKNPEMNGILLGGQV